MDALKQAIIKTLSYFDIFSQPLTSEELYRWLWNYQEDIKYPDFLEQLDLPSQQGYYFLPGREAIISERERRVKVIEEKMKIALRGIRKIRWVPFLRAVFVCNTLAAASVTEDSDIDVLIVVKRGRIFLTRALITLTLSLFALRRTKKKIKNKICLSFYITDDNLNLEKIALPEDIYLAYWLDQLIPVYDPDNLHRAILQANQWMRKFLPKAGQSYEVLSRWHVGEGSVAKKVKKVLQKIWLGSYGDLMESQARGLQIAKMKMNYMSAQKDNDTRVVVNEQMLKFHENDKREEYQQQWLENCNKYL